MGNVADNGFLCLVGCILLSILNRSRSDDTAGLVVDADNVEKLVCEVIRFFPPVGGFNVRCGANSEHSEKAKLTQLQLYMTQCDPAAWGPVKEYHHHSKCHHQVNI